MSTEHKTVNITKTEHKSKGTMSVEVHKTIEINNSMEAVEMSVVEGAATQRKLLDVINSKLREHRLKEISLSYLNEMINSPDSQLYRQTLIHEAIIEASNLNWLIEYWAEQRGMKLVPKKGGRK